MQQPSFSIVCTGVHRLGRCFYETTYRVSSTRPIDKHVLDALRKGGILGSGQGFSYRYLNRNGTYSQVPDSVARPFLVEPTRVDGEPGFEVPLFVYECFDQCDSGD